MFLFVDPFGFSLSPRSISDLVSSPKRSTERILRGLWCRYTPLLTAPSSGSLSISAYVVSPFQLPHGMGVAGNWIADLWVSCTVCSVWSRGSWLGGALDESNMLLKMLHPSQNWSLAGCSNLWKYWAHIKMKNLKYFRELILHIDDIDDGQTQQHLFLDRKYWKPGLAHTSFACPAG